MINTRNWAIASLNKRASFTLVELLISIAIMSILAATALFTLYGALESARESRTRAQIARLHEIIMNKWNDYLARPIRISVTPGKGPAEMADLRLKAIRELMRMELPDRLTDVYDLPVTGIPQPSSYKGYRRIVASTLGVAATPAPAGWYQATQPNDGQVPSGVWSYTHEGSECLYLILSLTRDEDASALDFFVSSEIGDTDNDGLNEILDGWGRPIAFLRWAPGFATNPGPDGAWGEESVDDDNQNGIDDEGEIGWPGTDDSSELQSRDALKSPDPFDPLRVDTRGTYALFPLLFSAGRDGAYGIEMQLDMNSTNNTPQPTQDLFHYSTTPTIPNDPYYYNTEGFLGRPDISTAGDNITNHSIYGG